ncbi:MAG TPA: FGGY-family carbohydrate kinase [Nocardioides sp.]|uniref:xylulokinase n=1 Tax=Nocardioides sp. TaxID=35761 RepID=UPI002C6429A7|nr:FGGY-family carbohydrate kinase [Nocardioides sp.]HQR28522.1 FGGY-family carbohydrate kinase [Nocardioides sp.]
MTGLVLAVDLGSGGPKVGYVTVTGEPVWWWYERADAVGGAEVQDAEVWWETVVTAARRGLAEGGVDGRDVVGVAVTGQWASTVPVDATGRPVAECLMWSDTRGGEYSLKRFGGPVAGYAPRVLATWLRRSGGIPNPAGADPVAHMLHLEHDRPEVTARARWYLEPVDYLTMRFTGVPAATLMSMTAAWLTDNRDLSSLAYDPVLVRLSGVNPSRLPPLVAGGSVVAPVAPEVAELIGIAPTAQVVPGVPDLHNAAIGSGCVAAYRPHMSLGTSSWVSCPVPGKKTDVIRQMAAVPGLGDGNYLLANNQDNAGRCLEWFRAGFAPEVSYDDLEALAAAAEPGSGGVLFTPWLNGERSPIDDRRARGGFHNVSLGTTRADLTRAVLEGVAMNMRWLLAGAEHFAGRRFDPIRLIGGCARMDVWCQILADVCDRTIERVADPLAGGLRGAGLTVGLALGEVRAADLPDLVPVDRVFTPDPRHRATYDRLFSQFPKLYSRNKKMFSHLNR